MMTQGCGNCLYGGKIELSSQGEEVPCLIYNQRHITSYKCNDYTADNNLPLHEKVKLAANAKDTIATQRRHQETVGVAKEANQISMSAKNAAWWAILISIVSLIVSIVVAIFNSCVGLLGQ